MNLIPLLLLAILAPQALRVYFLRPSARRRWQKTQPQPLSSAQKAELSWWQTWNITTFIAFLVFFIIAIGASWFHVLPLFWLQVLVAVYIAFGLGGLLHHYTARCPRCGMNIGVQSNLMLPSRCERCRVEFH